MHVRNNAAIQINNQTIDSKDMQQFAQGHYLHLFGFVNHVNLFLPYLEELKKHIFRIKSFYVISAKQKLRSIGCKKKSTTSVSIHVRMGDYLDLLHGMPESATSKYFTRAMEYFSVKYLVMICQNIEYIFEKTYIFEKMTLPLSVTTPWR